MLFKSEDIFLKIFYFSLPYIYVSIPLGVCRGVTKAHDIPYLPGFINLRTLKTFSYEIVKV